MRRWLSARALGDLGPLGDLGGLTKAVLDALGGRRGAPRLAHCFAATYSRSSIESADWGRASTRWGVEISRIAEKRQPQNVFEFLGVMRRWLFARALGDLGPLGDFGGLTESLLRALEHSESAMAEACWRRSREQGETRGAWLDRERPLSKSMIGCPGRICSCSSRPGRGACTVRRGAP